MIKFLLYSSALVVFGFSDTVLAACIQTPTCSSLGYDSSTSCEGGLKCPFGEAWNCTLNEKITELEKIIEEIKVQISTSNCQVGDILYSDLSCNSNYIMSKIPIGVVFDHSNKLAMALNEYNIYWATSLFDVPGLNNIYDRTGASNDYDGKNNTKTIWSYCQTSGYGCTAFEYVNNYTTVGTRAGDWYLPAAGELNTLYSNLTVLNNTLEKISKTELSGECYWSSSENSEKNAWSLDLRYGLSTELKNNLACAARPILAYSTLSGSSGETTPPDNSNCKVGDILYSDKSCSTDVVSGKTPIAVIFDTTNRLALAPNSIYRTWSTVSFDVPNLTNIASSVDAMSDFDGVGNTKLILDYCQSTSKSCPAVEYVHTFIAEGTQAGDWYLPAVGELNLIYENKDILNTTLVKIGGLKIGSKDYWSSSEYSYDKAWNLNISVYKTLAGEIKTKSAYVIPVIAY